MSVETTPDMAMQLEHADVTWRLSARSILTSDGEQAARHAPALMAGLHDTDEMVRMLSVRALGRINPAPVEALRGGLDPGQPEAVRMAAASELASVGTEAAPAIDDLILCFDSSNADLRELASFALGRIGVPAVGRLRQMLQTSGQPDVMIAALGALQWIGGDARPAIGEVRRATTADDDALRNAALSAAVAIDSADHASLEQLATLTTHQTTTTRSDAVRRLGCLCRAALPVVEHVRLRVTEDPETVVRTEACLALARIGPDEGRSVKVLMTALRSDPDADVRRQAAIALSGFPEPTPATRSLLAGAARRDRDPKVRQAAAASVAYFEHSSGEA